MSFVQEIELLTELALQMTNA